MVKKVKDEITLRNCMRCVYNFPKDLTSGVKIGELGRMEMQKVILQRGINLQPNQVAVINRSEVEEYASKNKAFKHLLDGGFLAEVKKPVHEVDLKTIKEAKPPVDLQEPNNVKIKGSTIDDMDLG